jgi:pilus assembly protein CpaC
MPYVGALFRNVTGTDEEIELLLMVTPQLVEALDPCDVPPDGPGTATSSPNDVQLYMKGHIEVPRCPADDACRPSLSPGSLYEFSRPMGGNPGAEPSAEGGVPEGEVVDPPTPEPPPSTTRRGTILRSPPTAAARPPERVVQDAPAAPAPVARKSVARPPAAEETVGPSLENRAVSYSPNNRSSRNVTAQRASAQSPPGIVGPVGYDVKN